LREFDKTSIALFVTVMFGSIKKSSNLYASQILLSAAPLFGDAAEFQSKVLKNL